MVCALYIPEVEFANVSTMEPIVLQSVPHERYNKVKKKTRTKTCTTCEELSLILIFFFTNDLCSLYVCRRVTSVKSRAERVKRPPEPA